MAGKYLKQGDSSDGCMESDAEDTSVGAGSIAGSDSSSHREPESEEFQMRVQALPVVPSNPWVLEGGAWALTDHEQLQMREQHLREEELKASSYPVATSKQQHRRFRSPLCNVEAPKEAWFEEMWSEANLPSGTMCTDPTAPLQTAVRKHRWAVPVLPLTTEMAQPVEPESIQVVTPVFACATEAWLAGY